MSRSASPSEPKPSSRYYHNTHHLTSCSSHCTICAEAVQSPADPGVPHTASMNVPTVPLQDLDSLWKHGFGPPPSLTESTLSLRMAPENGVISGPVSPTAAALICTADSNVCTAAGMGMASCTAVYLLACLTHSTAQKSCGQIHVQRIANPAVFCHCHNSCITSRLS